MPSLSRASCQEISRQIRQCLLAVTHSARLNAAAAVACLGLVLATIGIPVANAQAVYGSIDGTVVDSSGSTVANAKVTITDTDRNVVFTTETDSAGRYEERHLIAGHYQVKIEAQGFKSEVSKIDVSVDTVATFDATLQPGAVSETINVVDEVPLLKTERTDVSTVLSTRQVNELPTYGRNFSQLLLVTPGTVQFCWGDTSTENPQSGLAVNVNGQMFVGDNTILDGTDDRDFLYGNMLIVPNLDSIAETKVTTSSYDAEFGQISAALITVSTKSGTNNWHGSGFFYRRSDATFARDPFAQANPDPVTGRYIPPTLWGQFGGSIGGPIIKNKLFVFGDYQGTRAHDGGSALAEVPTQAERNGDFSAWLPNNPIFNPFCSTPGVGSCTINGIQDNLSVRPQFQYNGQLNVIDPSLISPVATALLNYVPLPLPALANNPPGQPNYGASGDEIYHADALDVRADYFYSDKLRLFDRYTFTQFHKEAPGMFGGAVGGPQLNQIGYTGVGDTRPQSNSFGVSYPIKPTLLMDARFGWYKQRINVDPLVNGNFATQAGAPGLNIPTDPTTNNMPHFSIQEGPNNELDFGNGLYNNCNCPLIERMQQFQGIGNFTWTVGKHTFKFGPDIHRLQNLRLPSDEHRSGEVYTTDQLTSGLVNASQTGGLGMAGFLLGDVSQFQRYISHVETAGERQWRFFFYGQDTWRVTQKLTLNYGLRWEIYRPQSVTAKDDGGWFNLSNGEIDVAGENGVPLSGPVVTNLKNFAPRVGLAFQATPKTVVRMGYGRSFDVGMFGTIFGHTVTQNLPVLGSQQINPLPNGWDSAFNLSVGPPLLDPATVLDSQPVGPDGNHIYPDGFRAWVMPFHTHMPTVDSWNATVQRQITPTLSLQAAYVGNKGSHIFVGENNWINLNTQTEAGFGILSQSERLPYCGNSNPTCGPNSNAPYNFGLTTGLQCMCNPGDNHYNSLQMQLDKRFSHGLNILGNYTFSHAKNHDSPDFLYDPAIEYGRPSWQRNQNITVSTIYELPFGKGKALAGNAPAVANYVIGGWQLVNVTTIMGGAGVNPSYGECNGDNDAGVCFPNVVGGWRASNPNRNEWFNQTALVGGAPTPLLLNSQTSGPWQRPAAPVPGFPSFGNASRNSIIGPKWFDSDLSVVKIVPVGEQVKVQFRAEAYNVFNHPNLGNPGGCVDCLGGATITGLANNATMRKMQFALRFDF